MVVRLKDFNQARQNLGLDGPEVPKSIPIFRLNTAQRGPFNESIHHPREKSPPCGAQ
jgi:hypothetical protein